MRLASCFSKTLRVDRPFGVFGLGVAPILAEGANGLPELDLLESAMAASTLRITEVSEGGSVPFLRAENVGRKPVLILDGEELVRREAEPDRQRQHHHPPGRGDRHPGVLHGGGQVELQPAGLPGGRGGVRARSRAVQKASVAASLDAEGNYRSDQGAVWREVSYSLRETQAPSPTSDYREGRAKVSHQDRLVRRARSAGGRAGRRHFPLRARHPRSGIAGRGGLLLRCLPKIIRSFAFEVLNDEDLGSVPEDVAASWWAGMQSGPCSRRPSPGQAMTSGSTRAR